MTTSFTWYELVTADIDAAQTFYGHVVGWTAAAAAPSAAGYRIMMAKDVRVAGFKALLPGQPQQPGWHGYVPASDLDGAVRAISAAGGQVLQPAAAGPAGRAAWVADPQGARFHVLAGSDATSGAYAEGVPGHCSWNELYTTDAAAALAFYVEQFGWSHARTVDMGPMGSYHVFGTAAHGDQGGMMNLPPPVPAPTWGFYFCVDDIDAAAARVVAAGGTVVAGPHAVPGGGWIVQAIDPQHAAFALVGPKS